ncbi:hypothetical protein [Lysobacter capsici]|uniref:hypothetical protein n=1 Tax=Lysobacter capsici TaxID=435897 RepID=UPI00129007FA|nr:hypothetical protein [Lysobacter capsici]
MPYIKPEIWFPVVTLIIGSLITALFDWLKDRRTLSRESVSRKELRSDALRLKRIEFQRSTLLDLQITAHSLCRQAALANLALVQAEREGQRNTKLPGTVAEDLRAASANFQLLRVRVRDSQIRMLCDALTEVVSIIAMSDSTKVSNGALVNATSVYNEMNEKIGLILRSLDSDEESLASER